MLKHEAEFLWKGLFLQEFIDFFFFFNQKPIIVQSHTIEKNTDPDPEI